MTARRPRLDAVFVQYDRRKYSGAFERFVAVLEALRVDYRVALVDNAHADETPPPEASADTERDNGAASPWFHALSSRITHLGGDNEAWEFSAFDRAVEFLDATRGDGETWPGTPDLWVFATDAFTAYGDEYLDLLNEKAVRFCLEANAAVGWVDSFMEPLEALGLVYQDWLRTSFLFVPEAILRSLGPLRTPLDTDRLFSTSPQHPFAIDAPISPELRKNLIAWLTSAPEEGHLEETWHSQFALDADSLDFFRKKASAILREHLLSARLQASGHLAFDLRLIEALDRRGLAAGTLDREARRRAAWNGWRGAPEIAEPSWHIDHFSIPQSFVHGTPERLKIAGWVAHPDGPPEIETPAGEPTRTGPAKGRGMSKIWEVEIRLGDHVLRTRCDIFRPDVLEAFPQLSDGRCGFELERALSTVPPGLYDVTWAIRGSHIEKELGRTHITPRLEVAAQLRWPQTTAPDEEGTIGLDARLLVSEPPDTIEALWNDQSHEAGLEGVGAQIIEQDGFGLYRCRLRGRLRVLPEQKRPVQRLELRFLAADGQILGTWSHEAPMQVEARVAHRFSLRRISPIDPDTGLADIEIAGYWWPSGGESLELVADGRPLAQLSESPQVRDSAPSKAPMSQAFTLRQRLPLTPGEVAFRLEAISDTGRRRLVHSWNEVARPAAPTIEVDHLRVRPPEGRRLEHLIFLAGWIEHHTAIEDLRLQIGPRSDPDAAPIAIGAVPIEVSRGDVAEFRGDPLMRRQAFHVELPAHVDTGAHELQLVALWLGEREVLWRRSAAFEAPVARNFLVESEALEALEQRRLGPLRAAIMIEGKVTSHLGEITASLFVDGHLADRQSVADGGSFRLRYRPEQSGTWPLRVLFESFGRTLYDSGLVPVACELLRISPELPSALERFFEIHGLEGQLGLPMGSDMTSLLLESHADDLDAYEYMLRDIGRVLDLAAEGAATETLSTPPPEPPRPGRPLRVLVASWEVPCRRHGGGVYLSDLLQRLGERHEITLIQSHGPGEEAWVEELRPHLHRVLSVPRQGQELPEWAFEPAIRSVCTEYVPDLRSTIESEVFSGRYDVVDYCYRWMLPHASRADVPQILTLLEDPFAARLSEAFDGTVDDGKKLERLDRLLLAFHFTACVVPRRFRFMTTVNSVDARWLRPLGNDRVRVNGIGVDLERFSASARRPPHKPRFVFVGNYRHPPSVDAARYAAEEVLPLLRRRLAGAQLSIVGAHPTPELEKLGERDGVTVTGFVDDIRQWLDTATAFIAPIFTGAGTRVKVLEAMASGTPVIGTPLAFQGIGGEHGVHYLQAETVGQFVDACQELAQKKQRSESIAKAARHWVEARHGLDARAREREELWFQAARGTRALPAVTGGR